MVTAADTAFAIASIRALERERPAPERLFDDPYAAIFSAAGAHAKEGTERFMQLPFFVDAIRLRTRFIDDFVREGLGVGIKQVVLLGAGFDARALRMAELAANDARVYEVDFAAQLEKKRELLAAGHVPLPSWVAHVPCDFSAPDFEEALRTTLQERGFHPGADALFVWEGVLAYIDAAAADRTLRFVAGSGGTATRLVFDFAPIASPSPLDERVRRSTGRPTAPCRCRRRTPSGRSSAASSCAPPRRTRAIDKARSRDRWMRAPGARLFRRADPTSPSVGARS
jgi:methyltransferase (TIGR00027 family)